MTKKRKLPSPRVLRRLLDYNPETGELRWKERPVWMFKRNPEKPSDQSRMANVWNAQFADKPAFARVDHSTGYHRSTIFNLNVYAHRVAWAMHHGEWPSGCIDHINGVRTDNRIENMRDVERIQNHMNMTRSRRNKSGVTGVFWYSRAKVWHAYISDNGKRVHLGSFSDKSDAIAARKAAEVKYGYHPNHGRNK